MDINAALLSWHLEMGVDEAIEDTAVNRFEEKPQKQIQPIKATSYNVAASRSEHISPPASPRINKTIVTEGFHDIIAQAEALAQRCTSHTQLHEAVTAFDGCSLKKTATNTVFADGIAESKIMLIGEAPGAQEDKQGVPFCGASGKLLDKILATIGLDRKKNLYITNNLFWRPPGNRRPTTEELAICAPFVKRHIELIRPKLLILAGGTSAASILKLQQGVTRARGKFYDYQDIVNNCVIPTMVIFHPSYLLRQPAQKRLVWQDMLQIQLKIAEVTLNN